MAKSKVFAALLVCAGICTRAHAQPVEVGGAVGGTYMIGGGGDFYGRGVESAQFEGRGAIRLSDRFGVEPFVTYGRRAIAPTPDATSTITGGDTDRTEGLYGVVVSQRLRGLTRPGFHVFLTYGVAGLYAHDRIPARQYTNGRGVYNLPATDYSENDAFMFPLAGIGFRKTLGDRLALRAETQLVTWLTVPVGIRASVGVAVPLGGTMR